MTEQRLDRPAQHSPAAPAASEGMSVRAGAPTPSDLRGAPPPLDAGSEPSSDARAENSEIERRVLALERILQALVAHMAETEPKFLARLSDSFCVPLRMTQAEHDYTDTDSYAAEFVRSVVRLGDRVTVNPPEIAKLRRTGGRALSSRPDVEPPAALAPIQVHQAGGVWHVTRDGRFYGDFFKEEDALRAAATAGAVGGATP